MNVFQTGQLPKNFIANFIASILNCMICQYIPFKKAPSRFKFPLKIRKLQSAKRSLWKKLKYNPDFKLKYKSITKQVEVAISNFYVEKEKSILKKGSDVKNFFKFFNSKLKVSSQIPDLIFGDNLLSDNTVKANAFNNFFGSVFTADNSVIPNLVNTIDHTDIRVKFTPESILEVLNKLKPSLSVGPDGLCAYFIKKLKYTLCLPLSIIFEVSYRTGKLPSLWKKATIVPVFKKGLSHSVENYRPVSLCCVSCKLMESVINTALVKHLDTFDILKTQQYGFRKLKSCTLQLLNCMNKWTKFIDSKTPLDIVYIDYQKAFDSVVHSKLLAKLEGYGISGFLLNWIKNFLSDRFQVVKVKSAISDPIRVISGVPQGSVLGPTLFLVFINDLVDEIKHSEILLFADDLKIFNTSTNHMLLQTDLNNVALWSKIWQLPISVKKSNILYLGKNNPKHDYLLDRFPLESVGHSCKDLGVYISSNLSGRVHCANIVAKASKISNMIHRCFTSQNPDLKVKAFKSYVSPILEY